MKGIIIIYSDCFYIIINGNIELFENDEEKEIITSGSSFGDECIIDGII